MKIKIFIISLILLASFLITDSAKAQDNSIVVILNMNNPVSELSEGQVKLYFLRKIKMRWTESNKSIKPADRIGMPQQKQVFYSKVLKMSAEDVGQYFIEKQISNAISPPDELSSEQGIVDFVIANEGAIAYISKSKFEQVKNQVKGVLVVN